MQDLFLLSFWVLFLPLSTSGADADLPIVLEIMHFDGTSILPLHTSA